MKCGRNLAVELQGLARFLQAEEAGLGDLVGFDLIPRNQFAEVPETGSTQLKSARPPSADPGSGAHQCDTGEQE